MHSQGKGEAMKKVVNRRPSAAMIVAIIAVVIAVSGSAVAANLIGLGDLSAKAKKKTVGVGKLTYVTAQQTYTSGSPNSGYVQTATCPSGTRPLGGGLKLVSPTDNPANTIYHVSSFPSSSGYTARFLLNASGANPTTVAVIAVCGVSQSVTGSPPSA
jgi:hypothetical protein